MKEKFFKSRRREIFINFEKRLCFSKTWNLKSNPDENRFNYTYSFSDEDLIERNLYIENGWVPSFVLEGWNATCIPTDPNFRTTPSKVLKEIKNK